VDVQLASERRMNEEHMERERWAGSRSWFERAQRVIPGAHHLSGRPFVSGSPPLYLTEGKGCRVIDVDGNEYIDWIMAYGAHVQGYADDEVDRAGLERLRRGSLLSSNSPMHVEFVEHLLPWFPGAEMAMFLKSGSEATTAALRIARRATGRRKVVRCGYHGWHDWCLPLESFVPAGLENEVFEFDARDPQSLAVILDAHRSEIAAVIVAPEMVWPGRPEPFHRIAALARDAGAVFVLDEVKTAFRVRPGSLQAAFDLHPDLTTVSKALGNGWPIAAVLGRRDVMECAAGMHCSATYHGDTAAMAAAMRNLELIVERGVLDHVWRQGERLIEGLTAAATRHGVPLVAYGEPLPPMPMLRATTDDRALGERAMETFCSEAMAGGVLLHPRHLWFATWSHGSYELGRTLEVADAAMAATARWLADR
jgi:glutamate-1-semialdehyde aminotransferase